MPLRSPLRTSRETTHTPQGDGNLAPQRSKHFAARNNPHPARGRKRLQCPCFADNTRNNPHPARGRKPRPTTSSVFWMETTHTPQGDGNHKLRCSFPRWSRNNPHPARGRKLLIGASLVCVVAETTHTPQGDGNCLLYFSRYLLHETTHTPQGDGNPGGLCHNSNTSMKQPTPRKGTETNLSSTFP